MFKSPNSFVTWYEILATLGVEVTVKALPARTTCPMCKTQTLRIFEDSKFHGGWHYCSRCKSSGDMIALAMATWKIKDVGTAITRLQANSDTLPAEFARKENIDAYVDQLWRRRQLAKEFAATLGKNLFVAEGGIAHSTVLSLALDAGLSSPLWLERMGRFFGISAKKDLAQVLTDKNYLSYANLKKWKSLVVVPFQNMPGRVSGFMTIGRNGNDYDTTFGAVACELTRSAGNDYSYMDPGLAMYENLVEPTRSDKSGNRVFVGPVVEALRLQAKHMRDSALPLPIVGTYNGAVHYHNGTIRRHLTYDSWHAHADRQFIFWMKKPSADVFNMASRCNGWVAWDKSQTTMSNELAIHRTMHYAKIAQPWASVLATMLEELPIHKRIRLLQELDLPEIGLERLRQAGSEYVRNILDGHNVDAEISTFRMGSDRIMTNESGWYAEPGQRLISTARLVIKRMLYNRTEDVTYYDGVILLRDREVPFVERADKVAVKTFEWMQQQLIKANAGIMQYDRNWSDRGVQLAMLFHAPVAVSNAGRCGWQADRGGFVFPKFLIKHDGRVESFPNCETDGTAPAIYVPNPETVVPQIKQFTDDSLESQLFWPVSACLAANLIAQAINDVPATIGLLGMGSYMAGRAVATAFGCTAITLKGNRLNSIATQLDGATTRHDWPVFIDTTPQSKVGLGSWLHSPTPRNVILKMDTPLVAALRMVGNCRFIDCDVPLTDLSKIEMYAATILPAWLQDLCLRKLELKRQHGKGLATVILEDMAAWAKRAGHDSSHILTGKRWLEDIDDVVHDAARYFIGEVCRLIDTGKLAMTYAGFEKPGRYGCTQLDNPAGIFVPRSIVNHILHSEGLPLLDLQEVTDALIAENVLETEMEYQHYFGWVIRTDWWMQQLKQYRKSKNRVLSVVG